MKKVLRETKKGLEKGLEKIVIAGDKLETRDIRKSSKEFKEAVYRDLEDLKARISESKAKWIALLASGKLALDAAAVNSNLENIEIMLPELSEIAKIIDTCYGNISAYPNMNLYDVKTVCEEFAAQQKIIKATEFDPKFKAVDQLLSESVAARTKLEQRIADKEANEHADSFMATPKLGV